MYADDFDFSYRITKMGGKIILVFDAIINDIDESWKSVEIKNPIVKLLKGNPRKTFYYVRNRTYFEMKNLMTSRFVYNVNIFIVICAMCGFSLFNRKNNLFLFFRALHDGKSGKLGKVNFI